MSFSAMLGLLNSQIHAGANPKGGGGYRGYTPAPQTSNMKKCCGHHTYKVKHLQQRILIMNKITGRKLQISGNRKDRIPITMWLTGTFAQRT